MTYLRDLKNNVPTGKGLSPRTLTASVNGPAQDMLAADGRVTAVQWVGTLGGTGPSLTGKVQESDDGSTWTDVTGATFVTVTTNDNFQAISFDRTKRYLRYVGTVGGTSPTIPVAVLFVEQSKQV